MTLTQQERDKFITWLDDEAKSIEQISEQMKKLKVPEAVSKKFETEIIACRIVVNKLRSIELVSI